MPRVTDTRQRMVRTAATLLRRQGYLATTWRQVVADSATPWGSQAHFFPGGKQELAVAALQSSGRAYGRLLELALSAGHPADAIALWVQVAATELEASEWAEGCPIATVALETAHHGGAVADACSEAFTNWRAALTAACTARGADPVEAHALATLVLAAIEGALLLARTDRHVEPLHLVGDQLASLLRARLS